MQIDIYRKNTAKIIFSFLSQKILNYSQNDALLDIDILLSFVLQKNRSWILSYGKKNLTTEEIATLENLVKIRIKGKPIAYIVKTKEFYGLDFFVDERVLIPKPDTETLVEACLDFYNEKILQNLNYFGILDLCSGSGCIGISIVKELCNHFLKKSKLKKISITFQDISKETLEVAEINAFKLLKNEIDNNLVDVNFICKDLKFGTNKMYDCIVSNPPYVPSKVTTELLMDGRSEPHIALDGGDDGLNLFPSLAIFIKNGLSLNGTFFVEAGQNIFEAIRIFQKSGFNEIQTHLDLSGTTRVFSGHQFYSKPITR